MREFGPSFVGVVALVMVFGLPIVAIVCHYAYEALKAWAEIGLKRDMVARGYTAQEIVEVLGAKKDSSAKAKLADVPPAKPVKQPAFGP
jgi:hypothetical protein